MKKLHTWVAVLGMAAVGGLAWWWQQRPLSPGGEGAKGPVVGQVAAVDRKTGAAPGAGGPVVVEVAPVQLRRLEDQVQAVGSLRSRQGVMLRPEVSGRVARLGFADGQRVRQGQMLVQLDNSLQQAQLQQAQAQASIARSNLQRNRELVAQNFVSRSAVDQTEAALEVALAQVALAQAQLDRMRLVAPFDGLAGIRNINVGDYVKDGADLVGIEDVSAMLVDFRLPESVLSRLKVGQVVEVSLDALPERQVSGRVDAIDATLDANGRSLLVRARLENLDGVLRPGLFARARIVLAVREAAVVVPEEALVPENGKQHVIKIEPPTSPGAAPMARRLEVRLGLRLPGQVEILDGLVAGDQVVIAGQARLMRGPAQPVKVVTVGAAPAPVPASAASASNLAILRGQPA